MTLRAQRRIILSTLLLTFALRLSAAVPDSAQAPASISADYYQSAYKLTGTVLRAALYNITKGHTVVSYNSLWTHFQATDKKANGKVWDMYSDKPGGTPAYEYTFVTNQCGSYSGEGSCYNREHSWPQSWFNEAATPTSDINHLFPTDGYVNGKRSNYSFGEVSSPSWTSTNGSKLGPNTLPGFTGTVFEPIDAYKGDLARGQMYMSVRYYTEDASWASSDGTDKSNLKPWYADAMYAWHMRDTVSTKEINRNNTVFTIQGKRNPFIDHPEFAAEIWKSAMPPAVVYGKKINATSLLLDFSRCLDSVFLVSQNFSLSGGIGAPNSLQYGVENDYSRILLNFASIPAGTEYTLQITNQRSINGVAMKDTTVQFNSSGVTSADDIAKLPREFSLEQNYPNPFNPATNINFSLDSDGTAFLAVYDVMGNEVAALANGYYTAGNHSLQFNASRIASGIYFYTLRFNGKTLTKKLALSK